MILDDEPHAATLRFGSHADALDFASHGIEERNRMLAANNLLGMVDRYRRGDVYLVLKMLTLGPDPKKCDLLFCSVDGKVFHNQRVTSDESRNLDLHTGHCDGDQELMFFGVNKLIQSPEGIIPSFVWTESSKDRSDFRRQILAASGQIVQHVSFSWPEGKLGGFGIGFPDQNGDVEGSLIQGGSKIVGRFKDNMGLLDRGIGGHSDLVNICNAIDIFLNDAGPSIAVREGVNLLAQIGELILCSSEQHFGRDKGLMHD